MSYRMMYSTIAEILVKEDKIQIVDSPNLRPLLEIRFYKYEDGYCIMVYKRLSGNTMYSVCRFKGTIKIEENKIMLIDFYQIPPIKPALFILFNSKIEVFIRKDIEDKYECPLPPGPGPRSWSEAIFKATKKHCSNRPRQT